METITDLKAQLMRMKELVEDLHKENDRLKAEFQFTRNEAIAVIRRKNEEISRLKNERR